MSRRFVLGAMAAATLAIPAASWADEAERKEIDANVTATLDKLYAQNAAAKDLAASAAGILVFPTITKVGLVIGGQGGRGALQVGGRTVGYYGVASASFGLQAGAQTYSQVLMFMTPEALKKFEDSDGWEAGVDGSIALIKQGSTISGNTTTMNSPIIGFIFGEQGLMASASIEGSKYSKLDI